MVDAVVGAVIMVVATTSLLLAVEVAEDAFSSAGRYPLNHDEQVLLDGLADSVRALNRASPSVLQEIDGVEAQLTDQLPRQYQ